MPTVRFALLPIRDLKTHEKAEPERVRRVLKEIRKSRVVTKAIMVDATSMVVLDGAHRLRALEALGCARAPAWLMDYSSDDVIAFSKGRKSQIPKEAVLEAAVRGPKFPPKTTRHMARMADGSFVHISKLQTEVSVPLSALMRPD